MIMAGRRPAHPSRVAELIASDAAICATEGDLAEQVGKVTDGRDADVVIAAVGSGTNARCGGQRGGKDHEPGHGERHADGRSGQPGGVDEVQDRERQEHPGARAVGHRRGQEGPPALDAQARAPLSGIGQ